MRNRFPKVGDHIEVASGHRFAGSTGEVVSTTDHPDTRTHHYHVRFDRDVWGAIGQREMWLSAPELLVLTEET